MNYLFFFFRLESVNLGNIFSFEFKLDKIKLEPLNNLEYLTLVFGRDYKINRANLSKIEDLLGIQISIINELMTILKPIVNDYNYNSNELSISFDIKVKYPVTREESKEILHINSQIAQLLLHQKEDPKYLTRVKEFYNELKKLEFVYNTNESISSRLIKVYGTYLLNVNLNDFIMNNDSTLTKISQLKGEIDSFERMDSTLLINNMKKLITRLERIQDGIIKRNKGLDYLDYFIYLITDYQLRATVKADFDYHFGEKIVYKENLETFGYYLQLAIRSLSNLINFYNKARNSYKFCGTKKYKTNPSLANTKHYNKKKGVFIINLSDEEAILNQLNTIITNKNSIQLTNAYSEPMDHTQNESYTPNLQIIPYIMDHRNTSNLNRHYSSLTTFNYENEEDHQVTEERDKFLGLFTQDWDQMLEEWNN